MYNVHVLKEYTKFYIGSVSYYVSLSQAHVNIGAMISGVPKMKTFRSATTLCIPDPTFNDITRHRLCLPQGSPVQRELLTGNYNDIPLLMFYRRNLGDGEYFDVKRIQCHYLLYH